MGGRKWRCTGGLGCDKSNRVKKVASFPLTMSLTYINVLGKGESSVGFIDDDEYRMNE